MADNTCNEATEYKIYTGDTETPHPVYTYYDEEEETVKEIQQCNAVTLGGNGVYN